jgi:integrase/recombinase XerD
MNATDSTVRYQTPMGVSGASSDTGLIALWMEGRSAHTRRAYGYESGRLLAFVAKPLAQVTLTDLYDYQRTLTGSGPSQGEVTPSPGTVGRAMACVKSLLSFGQKVGYLPFNVGAAVRLRSGRNALAERIISQADVHRMLALTDDRRDYPLLRFLYATGLRVSEVCGLTWRNMVPDGDTGFVNVHGKGDKTRVVRVPASVWGDVWHLKGNAADDAPVFVSRKGGPLDVSAIHRIVKKAAARANVPGNVSPHWLRHAHASHALDGGAPISLVQATLGHATIATTGRYLHARPGESSGKYLAL